MSSAKRFGVLAGLFGLAGVVSIIAHSWSGAITAGSFALLLVMISVTYFAASRWTRRPLDEEAARTQFQITAIGVSILVVFICLAGFGIDSWELMLLLFYAGAAVFLLGNSLFIFNLLHDSAATYDASRREHGVMKAVRYLCWAVPVASFFSPYSRLTGQTKAANLELICCAFAGAFLLGLLLWRRLERSPRVANSVSDAIFIGFAIVMILGNLGFFTPDI